MSDPCVLGDGRPDGTTMGASTSELISFYGTTPVAQVSGGDQAAITDSSGGTKSSTTGVSATAPKETVVMPIGVLSGLANSQTWKIALPYAFTVTAVKLRVGVPATTAAKAATLTCQINGTPVTGGVISATTANCGTTGATVDGTSITAANTGTAGQTLEVAVSSVTAFAEGSGSVEFTVLNNDKANQAATFAAQGNAIRSALVSLGLIKGSA